MIGNSHKNVVFVIVKLFVNLIWIWEVILDRFVGREVVQEAGN